MAAKARAGRLLRALLPLTALALVAALLPALATSANAAPTADLVILGGRQDEGNYLLVPGQPLTRPAHPFLTDTTNFGPNGTVPLDSLTIQPVISEVVAGSLDGVDVFFDGWVWDSTGTDTPQWSAGELALVAAWVAAGGVLVANEDSEFADELAAQFGVSVPESACCNSGAFTPVLLSHPLVDGPFGSWSALNNCGTTGHFGTGNVANGWTVVARDAAGNDAIMVRPVGSGMVILTADEGLFRDNPSDDGFGNPTCTADRSFIGNLFAWAHCLTDSSSAFALALVDPGQQSTRVGDTASLAVQTAGGKCSDITFTADQLPAGLSLDAATGVISGTPSDASTTSVTVMATTTTGLTDTVTFDWTVAPNLWPVATADTTSGTVGQGLSYDLCANDTPGEGINTAIPSGTVPPGLTVSACTLSGTPTATGDHQFTYVLADADQDQSAPAVVSVAIAPGVECSGALATIVGTPGDDVIMGTDGPDVIHGLGGDDEIHGLGGRDIICGGGGADELHGDGGRDTISGNKGPDTIFGGGKADVIDGNGGRDIISGNKGADVISGGKKADTLRGNGGADQLAGGSGSDECRGGGGVDSLRSCER